MLRNRKGIKVSIALDFKPKDDVFWTEIFHFESIAQLPGFCSFRLGAAGNQQVVDIKANNGNVRSFVFGVQTRTVSTAFEP